MNHRPGHRRRQRALAIAVTFAVVAACGGCEKARKSSTRDVAENRPAPARSDAGMAPGEPTVPPPAPTVVASNKGDCKTDYAPRPKRDPNPMCKVAGGSFLMGSPEGEGSADEHPQHRVTLSAFYIDQFEVTNAQYVHYLNAVGSHESCPTSSNRRCVRIRPAPKWAEIERTADGRYRVIAGEERTPAERVSREGAERYCAWAGKVLPTEARWEYAARHDPATGRDLRYPWGDSFEPDRANCEEAACKDGFDENAKPQLLAPVGTFSGVGHGDGSSPWGVHDMAGNASEWVADCYGPYVACKDACRDPAGPLGAPGCRATHRGSDYRGGKANLRTAERVRRVRDSAHSGFRCARSH